LTLALLGSVTLMKTAVLIAGAYSAFALAGFAAEPPKFTAMHLIDRSRIRTNATPAGRVSVALEAYH
jgi:hypothetical protein